MKKIIKNNLKTIFIVLITSVVCISGTALATFQYKSSDVSYSKDDKTISVENALNDLYASQLNKKDVLEYLENNSFSGLSQSNSFSAIIGHYYLVFYTRVKSTPNELTSGATLIKQSDVYNGYGNSTYAYGKAYFICATSTEVTFSGTQNMLLYIDLGTK